MDNALSIASFINIFIPVLGLVIIGGFFLYRLLIKTGVIKLKSKDESDVDITKAKKRPINDFNVVDEFRDRFIVTEGRTSFTTGLKCTGVSLDKLTEIEQVLVAENHVGFYNMLNWYMQLYIQSRQMDVSSNLDFIDMTRKKVEEALNEVLDKKKKIEKIIEDAPARKNDFTTEIEELNRTYQCLFKQLIRKGEAAAYSKKVASPENPPQFNVYILYSYKHDSADFSTDLTFEEILHKANIYVETKLNSTVNALKRCHVDSSPLSQKEIVEIMDRAYNLSDSDIVTLEAKLQTSTFDLYTSTDYYPKTFSKKIENEAAGGVAV